MNNAIIPLDFDGSAVRMAVVDGRSVWNGQDVCRALEIMKYRDAIAQLDGDQRVSVQMDTLGGLQSMIGVTESGLYALVFMSKKAMARRFTRWVTDEVLPAIRRQGYYSTTPEQAELQAKRDYYHALPDEHKERAAVKTAALARIAELVEAGERVSHAIAEVALECGLSVRTLYEMRRRTYMVLDGDHAAALAPRWKGREGNIADCHPEALQFYVARVLAGSRHTHVYRALLDAAQANGWTPIPSIRAMERAVARMLPQRPKASRMVVSGRAA